jgi:hypothetical protein
VLFFTWRGAGCLALIVPIAVLIAAQFCIDGIMGQGYYASHRFVPPLALVASAVIVWLIGRKVNSKEALFHTYPDTGMVVKKREPHTFFGMPMEWFSVLLVLYAGYTLLK